MHSILYLPNTYQSPYGGTIYFLHPISMYAALFDGGCGCSDDSCDSKEDKAPATETPETPAAE